MSRYQKITVSCCITQHNTHAQMLLDKQLKSTNRFKPVKADKLGENKREELQTFTAVAQLVRLPITVTGIFKIYRPDLPRFAVLDVKNVP